MKTYERVIGHLVVEVRNNNPAPLAQYADQVRDLNARGWRDGKISEELGISVKQVEGIRRRHGIESLGRGRPSKAANAMLDHAPAAARPVADPDASANARWCAMLAKADEVTWTLMRNAVCKVLKVDPRIGDEGLLVAAQHDRRSAEELANAYLLRIGRSS